MSDALENPCVRIVTLMISRMAKCGLCGEIKTCKHWDKDFGAMICGDCLPMVAVAQHVLNVAKMPAGGKGLL